MKAWPQLSRGTRTALCLGAILLAAAAVRTIGLGWGLPNQFHVTSYNCDEYTALSDLQSMDPAKLDFNPANESNPYALVAGNFNLYTYAALLKGLSFTGWIELSADKDFYYQNPAEWSKFFLTGRLLSAFYGILCVWAVYLLAAKMYGPRAGLLAAFFTALLPSHVIHSRYLIQNVPGTFWIILAFYFMKRLMDEGRTKDYFFSGMSVGLAISTRYSALPLPLVLLLAHFLGGAAGKSHKKALLSLCAAGLFFIIGTPYAILDLPEYLNSLKTLGMAVDGSSAPVDLFSGIIAVFTSVKDGLGIFVFAACLPGIALLAVRRKKDDLLLLSWIAILLAIYVKVANVASLGRILPVLPFLAIVAAGFLDLVWNKAPAVGRLFTASTLVHFLIFYGAYFRLVLATDIRDEASAWLAANVPPGASIGLVKEPSWFSPGLIDRKFRHPYHKSLPDYRFVPLTAGKWAVQPGYELLESRRPDIVVLSSAEAGLLPGPGLATALGRSGYSVVKEFRRELSLGKVKLAGRIPDMLYITDYIHVYGRATAAKGS